MKFAFMTWSTPQLTLEENLSLARQLGYNGIEPRIDGEQQHGIEVAASAAERRAIKDKAARSGIELCCVATSIRYADPQIAEEQVAHTRRCIDLCADVGSPRLRVFGGALPEAVTREQAIELVSESLLAVAEQAQEKGVTLCVELHDDWSDPRHLAAVMQRVNHPAIGANWDFIHAWWRVQMPVEQSFEVLRPWIRHVHVHDGVLEPDGNLSIVWIGEGQLDHRRAIELLQSINYDGYMSGEWINHEPDYREHLPREIATLRRYEQELTA
jgi:sugar phosphate isomerase/epimerase